VCFVCYVIKTSADVMTPWHIVVFEVLIVAYLIDQKSSCRSQSVQIFGRLLNPMIAFHEIRPCFIVKFSCRKWPILFIFSDQNYLRISELSMQCRSPTVYSLANLARNTLEV
jgi:hypothetical protein